MSQFNIFLLSIAVFLVGLFLGFDKDFWDLAPFQRSMTVLIPVILSFVFFNALSIQFELIELRRRTVSLEKSVNSVVGFEETLGNAVESLDGKVNDLEQSIVAIRVIKQRLDSRVKTFGQSKDYFKAVTEELSLIKDDLDDDSANSRHVPKTICSVSSYYKPSGDQMTDKRRNWLQELSKFSKSNSLDHKLLIVVPNSYDGSDENVKQMLKDDISVRAQALAAIHTSGDKTTLTVGFTNSGRKDMLIVHDRVISYLSRKNEVGKPVDREGFILDHSGAAAFERHSFETELFIPGEATLSPEDVGLSKDDFSEDVRDHFKFLA